MVVLVTGSQGQLGQALQSIAKNYLYIEFVFCGSKDLDITDLANIKTLFTKYKPHFCINAAAYTAVDLAEIEKDKAFEINQKAVANLADVCATNQTILVHISTDFVFDGSKESPYVESDSTNPLSIYGASKLAGEQEIQRILQQFYIVRTSWVYSNFGKNFLNTMLRLASDRSEISVVNDQKGCPTNAVALAETLLLMIQKTANKEVLNAYGLYHFSNKNSTTWFGFAEKIMKVYNQNCKVNPIPSASYPTPAKRPTYSVLDTSKIEEVFQIQIQNWDEVLELQK
jgi:dTDP-4-dehydrorhamnose reductase